MLIMVPADCAGITESSGEKEMRTAPGSPALAVDAGVIQDKERGGNTFVVNHYALSFDRTPTDGMENG